MPLNKENKQFFYCTEVNNTMSSNWKLLCCPPPSQDDQFGTIINLVVISDNATLVFLILFHFSWRTLSDDDEGKLVVTAVLIYWFLSRLLVRRRKMEIYRKILRATVHASPVFFLNADLFSSRNLKNYSAKNVHHVGIFNLWVKWQQTYEMSPRWTKINKKERKNEEKKTKMKLAFVLINSWSLKSYNIQTTFVKGNNLADWTTRAEDKRGINFDLAA